jgi:DNA primase catalytic subunit
MPIKKTITKSTPAKKSSTVGIKVTASPKAEMRKWEIESALSTLKRADEIRKDAKMMNDVKKLAQEQMSVLKTFSK